jgi:hypothetical protein
VKVKENKMAGACSKHARGKMRAGDWLQNLKETYFFGDSRRSRWVDNIAVGLKQDALAWTGFIWIKADN